MNKKNGVNHLGKPKDQRVALVRSQVRDLLERGYIRTTKSRAKAVSREIDMLLSDVADDKFIKVKNYVRNDSLYKKVFTMKSEGKRSGFTSAITVKNRPGDNAELVLLELKVN